MRLSRFILLTLCVIFQAYVFGAASQLPEKVATHFNLSGTANGWMTKRQHLLFTSSFGIGLPLVLVGIFAFVSLLPARLVNIPNREYWLAPERKAETCAWLQEQGVWLACVMVCWMGGLNYFTTKANTLQPPHMDIAQMGWLLFVPVIYVIFFVVQTFRRFKKR